MIYLIGIIGFVFGFLMGQALLLRLLRQYDRAQILKMMEEDRGARIKYGLLNWGIATAGMYVAIFIYRHYFS